MKQSEFEFYNTEKSLDSSRIIISSILPYLPEINTFLDFGCGVGAWSLALEEKGYTNYTLIDHPGLDRSRLLVSDKSSFIPIDLDRTNPVMAKFDLALCIEVLEHFEEKRALELLDFLCLSSDLILFSAAVPFQKGNGHINLHNHSYWHSHFKKRGFHFFDGFKRIFFEQSIRKESFFHFQNVFLYFRPEVFSFDFKENITSENFELRSVHFLNKELTIKDSLKSLNKAIFNRINLIKKSFYK